MNSVNFIFSIWCSMHFVNRSLTTPVNHLELERRRHMQNRYGVIIALAVNAVLAESSNNTIKCTQMFGGYTYKTGNVGYAGLTKDILENTPFSTNMNLRNVEVYGTRAFNLNCSPLKLDNLPADLIIIFPGGSYQNCQEGSSFCDVVIAKQTYRGSSRQKDPLKSCFTLFNGQAEIPTPEGLQNNFNILVENIVPVSYTCEPEAFSELLLGDIAAVDKIPLPEVTERTNNVVKEDENISITENSLVASPTSSYMAPRTSPWNWLLLTLQIIGGSIIILKLLKMCGFQTNWLHFVSNYFLSMMMTNKGGPPCYQVRRVQTKAFRIGIPGFVY